MSAENNFIICVLTSFIGMGFVYYGRRQKLITPLLSGIGLCFYTYFVGNLYVSLLIGIVLILCPFLFRI